MEALGVLYPLLVLFGLMYFFFIRPQQAQQKKRQAFLGGLKLGDQVITVGGIYGTIVAMQDEVVWLEIAEGTKIKLARAGVGRVAEAEHEEGPQS